MSLLNRLFARDEKFFDLLQTSAEAAKKAAETLSQFLSHASDGGLNEILADMGVIRRKHKRISQQITEEVCRDFATPLEQIGRAHV